MRGAAPGTAATSRSAPRRHGRTCCRTGCRAGATCSTCSPPTRPATATPSGAAGATASSSVSVSRALVAVLVGAALAAPAAAAAASPAAYLLGAQNADRGLPAAPGGASSGFVSGWAAIGLAAAGHAPRQVANGGPTLADYLAQSPSQAGSAGDVERTLLALGASGAPAPPELLTRLAAHRRADGSYDGRVNTTAFAILALRATGRA